jgi:hypothetical protein
VQPLPVLPCLRRCQVSPAHPLPARPFPVRDLKSVAIFGGFAASTFSANAAVVAAAHAALPTITDGETLLQVQYKLSLSGYHSSINIFLSQAARVTPIYDLPAPSKTKKTTDGRVVVSQEDALGSLLISKARRCVSHALEFCARLLQRVMPMPEQRQAQRGEEAARGGAGLGLVR